MPDKDKSFFEQVGCRQCGKGDAWKIYYDGKTFTAKCGGCGHIVTIQQQGLRKNRDKEFDMRFFV